ncbi:two-component system, sensor histidine kinase YesM [Eubacterium ruminantium]|uniref:Two-component system, sensor histidine kinase YesM n=1 Tax=Eubacterium ruminantium TaxID=42322 RepID=A0A1T4K3V4_9FIRM|nr:MULTISPECIES: histidine kinase [Eubacterium]MCR5367187.1 histidine kinase [Eubacterium sp.]SCW27895.1 two-component system, sensor histidine kinase YesM [Eubacterium ruminantium]SDM13320.1 two-component system, sensor histidine kinase YesM [Eubacterium ruminantium]SJZ37023.1 two-component system, sensor histidine kinase YesM [Eubacterium ruminantium]
MFRRTKKLIRFLGNINNMKLGTKFRYLFIAFVFVPLIVSSLIIINSVYSSYEEKDSRKHKNEAEILKNTIYSEFDYASAIGQNMYKNDYLERFLSERYSSPYEYFLAYLSITSKSTIGSNMGMDNARVMIYADNETILNGGEFFKLKPVRMTQWYNVLAKEKSGTRLMFYYDTTRVPYVAAKRKIFFLRKLDSKSYNGCERVLKIEMDYSKFANKLAGIAKEYDVYILGDNKVIYSNVEANNTSQNFKKFTKEADVGYSTKFKLYGLDMEICIIRESGLKFANLIRIFPLVLLFVVMNICLPLYVLSKLEKSLIRRLNIIEQAFSRVNDEELHKIEDIPGSDEISELMNNYNVMVDRTNSLIQTVYKDKLNEREMDIARQNAELLALHSQINPHFLFNALESIRMHSIIKREYETADMVECLAVMQRNNTNWGNDMVSVRDEAEFVKAYLELQKYRFGDRLSYRIEIDKECEEIVIPKLTIVTFAENACIHGIEKKAKPGWIFVRVYKEERYTVIEVEDTGAGMTDDEAEFMKQLMATSSIENLKTNKHVGIMNACLRLKMMNKGVSFRVESEDKTGTLIEIRIPFDEM